MTYLLPIESKLYGPSVYSNLVISKENNIIRLAKVYINGNEIGRIE